METFSVHDQDFDRSTKMPRYELEPVVQKFAMRIRNEIAYNEVIKNACVAHLAKPWQKRYRELVQQALPRSTQSPHLFLTLEGDDKCKEGYDITYFVLLALFGTIEILLLVVLISMRYKVDKVLHQVKSKA